MTHLWPSTAIVSCALCANLQSAVCGVGLCIMVFLRNYWSPVIESCRRKFMDKLLDNNAFTPTIIIKGFIV